MDFGLLTEFEILICLLSTSFVVVVSFQSRQIEFSNRDNKLWAQKKLIHSNTTMKVNPLGLLAFHLQIGSNLMCFSFFQLQLYYFVH